MEALTATLLLIAVMGAALRTLATLRRAVASVTGGAESRETARIARHTLSQEVRASLTGVDWATNSGDSVALRAFRGTGVACGSALPPTLAVRYAGLRRPDPSKDSVLVLDAEGMWRTADLVRARTASDACGPGEAGELWQLDPPVPGAVTGRVFERGSYHVATGAFRYRPGRGGRQPLTAQVLRTGAGSGSGVSAVGAGLELRLEFERGGSPESTDSIRIWPREVWP